MARKVDEGEAAQAAQLFDTEFRVELERAVVEWGDEQGSRIFCEFMPFFNDVIKAQIPLISKDHRIQTLRAGFGAWLDMLDRISSQGYTRAKRCLQYPSVPLGIFQKAYCQQLSPLMTKLSAGRLSELQREFQNKITEMECNLEKSTLARAQRLPALRLEKITLHEICLAAGTDISDARKAQLRRFCKDHVLKDSQKAKHGANYYNVIGVEDEFRKRQIEFSCFAVLAHRGFETSGRTRPFNSGETDFCEKIAQDVKEYEPPGLSLSLADLDEFRCKMHEKISELLIGDEVVLSMNLIEEWIPRALEAAMETMRKRYELEMRPNR